MNLYAEPKETADGYRRQYLEGIRALVEARRQASGAVRSAFMADLPRCREQRRDDLRAMLGWPLTEPPRPAVCIRSLSRRTVCALSTAFSWRCSPALLRTVCCLPSMRMGRSPW